MLRTLHLFAGDGGGLWADLILGHRPTVAVEIEPRRCDVLEARERDGVWAGLRVYRGDVQRFDAAAERGLVDIVAAGSPCQGFSVAGKRLGMADPRSALIRETFRVADDARAAFIFMENSPRVVGLARTYVTGELVARGYRWRDGILSAADVGAPHQRKRWWLLAAHPDRVRQLQSEGRIGAEWGWAGNRAQAPADAVCPGLQVDGDAGVVCESTLAEIEAVKRYTGARAWNPPVSCLRGVVDGQADRGQRIAGLGNSQVPLCAAAAWRLLGGP